jgi:hypothetical protein
MRQVNTYYYRLLFIVSDDHQMNIVTYVNQIVANVSKSSCKARYLGPILTQLQLSRQIIVQPFCIANISKYMSILVLKSPKRSLFFSLNF